MSKKGKAMKKNLLLGCALGLAILSVNVHSMDVKLIKAIESKNTLKTKLKKLEKKLTKTIDEPTKQQTLNKKIQKVTEKTKEVTKKIKEYTQKILEIAEDSGIFKKKAQLRVVRFRDLIAVLEKKYLKKITILYEAPQPIEGLVEKKDTILLFDATPLIDGAGERPDIDEDDFERFIRLTRGKKIQDKIDDDQFVAQINLASILNNKQLLKNKTIQTFIAKIITENNIKGYFKGDKNNIFQKLDRDFISSVVNKKLITKFDETFQRLIYPLATFKPLFQIGGVQLLPGGKQFLSWPRPETGYTTIRLWNIKTGKRVHTFTGHTGYIWGVQPLPGGKQFLSWSKNEAILWDLTGQKIRTFTHTIQGRVVQLLSGGKQFLSRSNEEIILWDITGKKVHTFTHTDYVDGVLLLPGSKQFFSWSAHEIILWDLTGQKIGAFRHTRLVWGVQPLPGGKQFLWWSKNEVILWDLTRQKIRTFRYSGTIRGVQLLQNGKQFLSWSDYGRIFLWDIETDKVIRTFTHTGTIKGVQPLQNGKQFLSWSLHEITLWDLTGQKIRTFTTPLGIKGILLLPGGKQFLPWSEDRTIRLLNINPFEHFTFDQLVLSYMLQTEKNLQLNSDWSRVYRSLPKGMKAHLKKILSATPKLKKPVPQRRKKETLRTQSKKSAGTIMKKLADFLKGSQELTKKNAEKFGDKYYAWLDRAARSDGFPVIQRNEKLKTQWEKSTALIEENIDKPPGTKATKNFKKMMRFVKEETIKRTTESGLIKLRDILIAYRKKIRETAFFKENVEVLRQTMKKVLNILDEKLEKLMPKK